MAEGQEAIGFHHSSCMAVLSDLSFDQSIGLSKEVWITQKQKLKQ